MEIEKLVKELEADAEFFQRQKKEKEREEREKTQDPITPQYRPQ